MADLENKEMMNQENTEGEVQDTGKDETPDVNALMTELAELKAANAKQKNALDKALKNNGDLTKQLRAKMTAEEIETEEKRKSREAHDNYVKGLEKRIAIMDATERYTGLGMDINLAKETAGYDVSGDRDSVDANLKKFLESKYKQLESEWIKNRPQPQAGGNEHEEDAFLKGFNSVPMY